MYLNRLSIKELEYFDMLRLDGKDAQFDVSKESMCIRCDGMQYDFERSSMKCTDIDVSNVNEMTVEAFKKNEVPLDTVSMNQTGKLFMFNIKDTHWVFVFMSREKHICLISTGSFEKTLGEL